MYSIIRPILTEKSAQTMAKGLYVLAVTDQATKTSIKDDIKRLFNLEATDIRIVNLPAKRVRFRTIKGTQSARRRAYVQLKSGQTLPGFELKEEKAEPAKKTKKTKDEESK